MSKEDNVQVIVQPEIRETEQRYPAIFKLNHIECVIRTIVMKDKKFLRVEDTDPMPLTHAFHEMKKMVGASYLKAVQG